MTEIARSPKQIGAIVRQHRDGRDLTQGDIAGLAGVRQATVSDLETGDRDARLATLLDVLAALDLELVIRPRSRGDAQSIEDIF